MIANDGVWQWHESCPVVSNRILNSPVYMLMYTFITAIQCVVIFYPLTIFFYFCSKNLIFLTHLSCFCQCNTPLHSRVFFSESKLKITNSLLQMFHPTVCRTTEKKFIKFRILNVRLWKFCAQVKHMQAMFERKKKSCTDVSIRVQNHHD